MKYPNWDEEKNLWKQGFKCVVGLDEAGRGPLAGPVVAAAVAINPKSKFLISKKIPNIKDSKQLTEKQREECCKFITNHPKIRWGIGIVSEKVIDKINILEATKLAMEKAIKKLNPDFLLLDGNFTLHPRTDARVWQKAIVRGDQKVISISAASIIAKVTRDRIMQKMHKKYPQYGFDKHKGYPTALHVKMLGQFGKCPIHRTSFYPVNTL